MAAIDTMMDKLRTSRVFSDTKYMATANDGKNHCNVLELGQGLLTYVGSDSFYADFYYNEPEGYLSAMVNLGKSKSSKEKDNAMYRAVNEIKEDYKTPDFVYSYQAGGCTFSLSRYGVPLEKLEELFEKFLLDIEYVLKATLNPAYYQ